MIFAVSRQRLKTFIQLSALNSAPLQPVRTWLVADGWWLATSLMRLLLVVSSNSGGSNTGGGSGSGMGSEGSSPRGALALKTKKKKKTDLFLMFLTAACRETPETPVRQFLFPPRFVCKT
jgi:hypothetical protein